MAGLRDFKLDNDGDLALEDFDFSLIDENERIRQQIQIHLQIFKAEWFLDSQFGVPFLENILGKQIDPALAADIIKSEIMKVDDVIEFTSFSIDIDKSTRTISATFSVITTFSAINNLTVSL